MNIYNYPQYRAVVELAYDEVEENKTVKQEAVKEIVNKLNEYTTALCTGPYPIKIDMEYRLETNTFWIIGTTGKAYGS